MKKWLSFTSVWEKEHGTVTCTPTYQFYRWLHDPSLHFVPNVPTEVLWHFLEGTTLDGSNFTLQQFAFLFSGHVPSVHLQIKETAEGILDSLWSCAPKLTNFCPNWYLHITFKNVQNKQFLGLVRWLQPVFPDKTEFLASPLWSVENRHPKQRQRHKHVGLSCRIWTITWTYELNLSCLIDIRWPTY